MPSTNAPWWPRSGPPAPAKPISPSPRPWKRWSRTSVGRIVLSRPAVEAGESLGFLPGDLQDKLAPYLRPLYDALTERLGTKRLKALLAEGIDRDRARRLYARTHAQRLLRGHRRGAELHLWAAQDAAHAARLALHDGADGRSGSDRSAERAFGPGRDRRRGWSACPKSQWCGLGDARHRAPSTGGEHVDGALEGDCQRNDEDADKKAPIQRERRGQPEGDVRTFLLQPRARRVVQEHAGTGDHHHGEIERARRLRLADDEPVRVGDDTRRRQSGRRDEQGDQQLVQHGISRG